MYRTIRTWGVALLGLLLWMGCDSKDQQREFEDDANLPPAGITETDNNGQLRNQDDDDWRTSPFFFGKVRVDPAFPNPTLGQIVTIPVTILEFNAVRGTLDLRARDPSQRLILLDQIRNTDTGAHIFQFSPGLLGTVGLHRLFVFDSAGDLISYGDLLLE